MRKKQIIAYVGLFVAAVLAVLGIAYGIRAAIRAGNLEDIKWYSLHKKEFVISTEKELYEFAVLSDYYDFEGQTIKLGEDIVVNGGDARDWHKKAPSKKWQPITEFAGTFDGQGHTISGLYGKSSSMSMGLFSETKKGCVIRDFKLLNSYFCNTTNNGLGSIIGEGAGEIKKVYSDAIVYGYGESNGGFAGLIKDELFIQECWFDGQVIGEQRSNGGFIGWVDRKSDVTIDNCLNSGKIQFNGEGGSSSGGFVGNISELAYRMDVSQVEITNSLSTGEIDTTNLANTGSAVGVVRKLGALTIDNTYAVIKVTDDVGTENTIGNVSGKLTGNVIPRYKETLKGEGGYQWTNLDFDKYWSCVKNGTPTLKYFTENELDLARVEKKIDTSWYKQGKNEYVLKDTADFWGFALISASTNFEGATIKLDADIILNEGDSALWKESAPEYNWFPCYTFSGSFDGQGHTISGMYCYTNGRYVGLFKQVSANASIRNLKLENSYIRGTYCVGSLAGHGGGNLSRIYSDAIVENTGDHTGGILGAMNQNGTMSECWFDGIVYGGTSYTGGLTSATGTTMCVVMHSLNTGTVYGGTGQVTGGLVGLVNRSLTISDSLNVGKVDDSRSAIKDSTGSVIGRITNSTEEQQVTTYITSTYGTRESYHTSIGKGYPTSGSPFVNHLSEIKGNSGYQKTLLNFKKYWAIDKDNHPTLQAFATDIPELPDVTRPIVADTDWFDEDETVFVIKTPEQLYGFAQLAGKNDFEGKTVKLGANIKINSGSVTNLGKKTPLNQWAPIHSFNGTFDGCGYTISGLYINDGLWRVGLFGNITEKATIKNVKLTNSYLEGAYHVGSICGWLQESTIQGVYSNAKVVVREGHGGGILGTTQNGKIENAWFAGNVSGDGNYIGGIASFVSLKDKEQNKGTSFSNCLNTGKVQGVSNVGGLVGRVAAKTTIKYSLNTGKVTGANAAGSVIGFVVADEYTSCNVAEGVYATKESTKNTVGSGAARGSVIVNTTADLTGVGGYQRTILDFKKYWSIVENGTPILKKYGGTSVSIPNVERAVAPDTSWYKANKKTFVLNDYADFYGFAVLSGSNNFAGKTIKLGKNIVGNSGNAEDFKKNTPLNQLVSVGDFAGTFDGQGHTISGLSSNNDGAWYVGIFNKTAPGAVIKNLNVENSYIVGEYHVGSVVGMAEGVTIQNVYSNAILEATEGHVGGMVGTVKGKSKLLNCWFDGSATAQTGFAGGMTSFASSDTALAISHCLNTAPIKATTQAAGFVGRVVSKVTITDSLNTGIITGGTSGSIVGMILDDGKVTLDAVYGTKESASFVVGKGTDYSGDTALLSKVFLEERSGYTLTNLNFDKYWIALEGETPKLSYFSDKITEQEISLKGVEHMDTSWYKDDKKSYVLKDRADLYGFTYLVNSGKTFKGKTVSLGKNIKMNDGNASDWENGEVAFYLWMPIGSYEGHTDFSKSFMGTFDGKMHTISGLYTKNIGDGNKMYNWCAGLFGKTGESATIKNMEVLNSYFESPYYSGVVGYSAGSTIDTVYTDAIVVATSGNTGGIVGSAKGGSINNTWFDGKVANSGQFTGGIVGVVHDNVTLSNCLTTGEVKSTTNSYSNYIGGLTGGVIGTVLVTDSISVPRSFNVATEGTCIGSIVGGVNQEAKATVTNTYTLNGISKLAIGRLENPESNGDITDLSNICSNLKGLNGFSLTKLDFANYWVALSGKTPELMSFSDGNALAVDTAFRPSTKWYTEAKNDADGNEPGTKENPYVLYNKVDLYGLAELVNKGTTFKGKYVELGADITVNTTAVSEWTKETPNYEWEPIGSYVDHTDYSKSFAGQFDGNEYSISGLYTKKTGADNNMNNWCAGLFGRTSEGASVRNVSVVNSYFESPYYNGVVGHATNTSIANVYTDAMIEATSGNSGGIAGALMGGSVEGSWYAGTITSEGQMIGGIVGIANGDAVINNCLTTGTVKSTHTGTSAFAGGLVGAANGDITLKNSVSAAKEVSSKGERTGAVFGSALSNSVLVNIENVYTETNIYPNAVGKGATGNYGGQPKVMPTLKGYNGYTLTKLDFENVWMALEGKTPELKIFSSGKALNLADSFRPDTVWEGLGTKENPYVISSKAELYGLAEVVNEGTTLEGKAFILTTDIEVNDVVMDAQTNASTVYQWIPIGSQGKKFAGALDGNGHTIRGLYTNIAPLSGTGNANDNWYVGLFGIVNTTSSIENIRIENCFFKAEHYAGSVVGMLEAGTVENVYSEAYVQTSQTGAGGIVGAVKGLGTCVIQGVWFKGSVTAGSLVCGGIVGASGSADAKKSNTIIYITDCLNEGTIRGTQWVGGLVGRVVDSETDITDCLTVGSVTGTKDVGSVFGTNQATCKVSDVYAKVSGSMGAIGSGSVTGTISTFTSEEDYYGEGAYILTNLDFENDWTLIQGEIPKPKHLVDSKDSKIIDINAWYKGSTGTEENPYVIKTKGELYDFAKRANASTDGFNGKRFVLADDITFGSVYNWIPIGTSSKPFKGILDGNGYSVSGLYSNGSIDTKNKWYVGMFGYLNGATIKNLKVLDSQFQGEHYVGSIAGTAMNSTIDTVYTNATINATSGSSGGLVGHLSDGTIKNGWFDGQITIASQIVGGIAGLGNGNGMGANIVDCLVTGKIISNKASGQVYAGGILGIVNSGSAKITNCMSAPKEFTTKTGVTNVDSIIGGGASKTTISGTYAVNDSNADDYKGVNGYLNTKLEFDRPETPTQTEGCWVATEVTPVLKSFFDMQNAKEVDIAGKFRVDTEWSLSPVKKVVDGVEKDTYTIDRPEELLGLANKVNAGANFEGKVIYLGADIVVNTAVMNVSTNKDSVQQWTPIGAQGKKFAGAFDGNGHTISGLYTNIAPTSGTGNANNNWYAGLFGIVNTTAKIENVSIKNSYFKAEHYAGSVAGMLESGSIENVYSEAHIQTSQTAAGGIVGIVKGLGPCTIQESWFKGSVTAGSLVCGGIVGASGSTDAKKTQTIIYITNCLNEGTIQGTQWVGGFVGRVVDSETDITDCLTVGIVKGTKDVGNAVGINQSTCKVTDVYALISNGTSAIGTGSVTGMISTFTDTSAYYGNNALTELQSKWDFNGVWTVRENNTPALKSWCK